MRTSSGELLVELRRDNGVPLHQQLESGIRTRIRGGLLRADTVMPSTRALAQDLGLSRGVVVEAYQQLVAEGYLVTRAGGSTQVADIAVVEPAMTRSAVSGPPRIDFRYSRPDVSQFSPRCLAPFGTPGVERDAVPQPGLYRRPRHPRAPDGARRLPEQSPRYGGRPVEHADLQRFRAGLAATADGAGRAGLPAAGGRGSVRQ